MVGSPKGHPLSSWWQKITLCKRLLFDVKYSGIILSSSVSFSVIISLPQTKLTSLVLCSIFARLSLTVLFLLEDNCMNLVTVYSMLLLTKSNFTSALTSKDLFIFGL
ncbi:hypothetical protein A0H76_2023 [Hepatospora eriocheir]|uniref:Uncharacterized protein n=1 Tax=Hepatospora eriocheir TaxID=1081669 RepID=A0A1X0QGC2_9MICR|nr:hypothetical protein A0H76_2023 [Hepatospora eriocheir]